MFKADLDRLLNKALQAPSVGGGCVIPITVPYWDSRALQKCIGFVTKPSHRQKFFLYFYQGIPLKLCSLTNIALAFAKKTLAATLVL